MAAKKKAKRKPNPAFMKAMQPDAALAAVVGDKAMPRTEVTKKLWAYIKKHKLQDNKNRPYLICLNNHCHKPDMDTKIMRSRFTKGIQSE